MKFCVTIKKDEIDLYVLISKTFHHICDLGLFPVSESHFPHL